MIPFFKLNSLLILLHVSHAGIMYSLGTLELYMCAPKVGLLVHPEIEHSLGHDLPELLIQ